MNESELAPKKTGYIQIRTQINKNKICVQDR